MGKHTDAIAKLKELRDVQVSKRAYDRPAAGIDDAKSRAGISMLDLAIAILHRDNQEASDGD